MNPEGRGIYYCRGCGSENLFSALKLKDSPVANSLLNSSLDLAKKFPLDLRICKECSLGQIGEHIPREVLFDDYPYFSSTSKTWLEKNKDFAKKIFLEMGLSRQDLVLEIASNDGYQLKFFKELGVRVLGIEPSVVVANVANDLGIPTMPLFFGLDAARTLSAKGITPKLIIAKNVLAHVPDLEDFVSGLSELCDRETLIVVEAPTILQITRHNQFDTIYHEHFSYLSIIAIKNLFQAHGMRLWGAERVSTHGGSVRFYAKSNDGTCDELPTLVSSMEELIAEEVESGFSYEHTWGPIRTRVEETSKSLSQWLEYNPENRLTVAYGAAAKAITLLSQVTPHASLLDYVIDNSPGKVGKFLPLNGLRILSEREFRLMARVQKMRFIIFPWNLVDEILPRIRKIDPEAEVVVAIPELKRL